MSDRTAQRARIMAGAYSDLAKADSFKPVPMPVDVTDAERFPRIANIARKRARMTPEQRKALNAGWPEDWA